MSIGQTNTEASPTIEPLTPETAAQTGIYAARLIENAKMGLRPDGTPAPVGTVDASIHDGVTGIAYSLQSAGDKLTPDQRLYLTDLQRMYQETSMRFLVDKIRRLAQ